MSCFNPQLTSHSEKAAAGWTLEVRWRSLQRETAPGSASDQVTSMRTREFVARVAVLSYERCVIEAWIECDGRRTPVLAAQLSPVVCSFHEGLWHVDVFDAAKRATRLLALSIECNDRDEPLRLWYVTSPLLATSGFAGGSYDRPALFATPADLANVTHINGTVEIAVASDARRHDTVTASA
jgi:hypothetical protein